MSRGKKFTRRNREKKQQLFIESFRHIIYKDPGKRKKGDSRFKSGNLSNNLANRKLDYLHLNFSLEIIDNTAIQSM